MFCQFNYLLKYCWKSIIFSIIALCGLVEPGFESSLNPSRNSEGEGLSRVWTQAYNWPIRGSVLDPCPCLVEGLLSTGHNPSSFLFLQCCVLEPAGDPSLRENPLSGSQLYCTVLYSLTLHCITLYSLTLHCITLYCLTLHCITVYCLTLHCITLHSTTLYCLTLYCITLHCLTMYCITVHCIIL